ncbi:MAG: NAD(P)/FAD-dependent oxidoreductase [Proteobacteria bacterium]|nr:NAD(P)/FAD-dependent oxidoreductase [Pseudomonadota bacterium]MBU1715704.1 NAD(P)/FAD-dependent oxidoreductase [Pseudomonadota bacterium]
MSPSKIDAVVIGSGISGLTAAGLLAKNGRKVVIVEQNKKPGGALRRFKRAGIPFDIGFHYSGGLGQGQILQVLWEYLGVLAGIKAVPLHPAGCDFLKFRESGTEVKAFYSYDLLQNELCRVFPQESAGIELYLGKIKEICAKNPFYNLNLELTPFLKNFTVSTTSTLADNIISMVSNQELQAVLAAPAFLHGVSPNQVDINMHAVVAHGYYSGAFGIDGGGQAIIDEFVTKLTATGVEIITDSPVENIDIYDDRVKGLMAGGKKIRTKNVIYTGHPHHLPDLVAKGTFRPAYNNRLKDLTDTTSMFMVFGTMATPSDLPLLDNSNLYSMNKGLNLFDLPGRTETSRAIMLIAPGRRDHNESQARQGIILMRPASWQETSQFTSKDNNRTEGYTAWKTAATQNLLDRASETFGDSILEIKPLASASPLTFRDELGSPQGGVYGVQHSINQYVARARTKVEGLYLSGQGSLMTGLFGSSMAGLITAGELLGMENIWDKVRNCH